MAVLTHGERLVAITDITQVDEELEKDEGASIAPQPGPLSSDGARDPQRWLRFPHDGLVALPMWEGLEGRWRVHFSKDEDDETERHPSEAQLAAAKCLIKRGAEIREAFLTELAEETGKDPRSTIHAGTVQILAENIADLAYSRFDLHLWEEHRSLSAVFHGDRLVRLVPEGDARELVEDDMEAVLREKKRAEAKSKPKIAKKPAASKPAKAKKKR